MDSVERDEMYNEYARENEPDHIQGYCKECGKYVTSITQDVGIGPYEFWGARGNDIQLIEVSPCCESEVINCDIVCHANCKNYQNNKCSIGRSEPESTELCIDFSPKN